MTNVKVFKTVPNVQKLTDFLFPARPFLLRITDKTDIFKNHKRVASRKRNQKATFLAESGFFETQRITSSPRKKMIYEITVKKRLSLFS